MIDNCCKIFQNKNSNIEPQWNIKSVDVNTVPPWGVNITPAATRWYYSLPSLVDNICHNIPEPYLEDDIDYQEVDFRLINLNHLFLLKSKGFGHLPIWLDLNWQCASVWVLPGKRLQQKLLQAEKRIARKWRKKG